MSKNLLDDRRFLNKNGHHSVAAISVTVNHEKEEFYFSPIEVEFSISDCTRKISLNIDTETEDKLNNSLFKLQQIIEVCQNAKDCLESARGIVKEHEENERKRREQAKKDLKE